MTSHFQILFFTQTFLSLVQLSEEHVHVPMFIAPISSDVNKTLWRKCKLCPFLCCGIFLGKHYKHNQQNTRKRNALRPASRSGNGSLEIIEGLFLCDSVYVLGGTPAKYTISDSQSGSDSYHQRLFSHSCTTQVVVNEAFFLKAGSCSKKSIFLETVLCLYSEQTVSRYL